MGVWAFLISFGAYVWTTYPTVTAQDSGELIVGPATLSIVHPPGYPLYSLLGHVWTVLWPLGSVGFRVNLFSAVMTALAVWGVYALLRRFTSTSIALAAALGFAGVSQIWDQADAAEVYALNLAATAWGLYTLFRWTTFWRSRDAWLMIGLWGVALANHHLMMLWAPVLLIALLFRRWRQVGWAGFLVLGLGVMLYLYLPLRSLAQPPMDWGNPESWTNIWSHILRRQYAPVAAGNRTLEGLGRQLFFAGEKLWEAWSWLLLGAVIGWAWIVKRRDAFGVAALGLFLFLSAGIAVLTNFRPIPMQVHQVRAFFTPALLCTALAVGWGAAALHQWIEARSPIWVGRWVVPIIFIGGAITQGATQLPLHQHQREHIIWSYGLDLLRSVPEGSAVTVTGDFPTFPLGYLIHVEGYGRGRHVGDDAGSVLPYLTVENSTRTHGPFYTGMSRAVLHDERFGYVPEGLVYRVLSQGAGDHNWKPRLTATDWRRMSFGHPLGQEPLPGSFTRYMRNQYYAFGLAEWTWAMNDRVTPTGTVRADSPSRSLRPEGTKGSPKTLGSAHSSWARYAKIIHDPMAGETLIQTVGTLLERRGAYAEAEECFEVASRKATWSAQPLLILARLAAGRGDATRAEQALLEAKAREPESAAIHFQLGNFLGAKDDLTGAVEAYQSAIRLDPGLSAAYKNLGAVYIDLKDYPKAIQATQTAIKLNPSDYQLYANLGAIFYAAGDHDRALAAWSDALRLHPGDQRLMAMIAKLKDGGATAPVLQRSGGSLPQNGIPQP